MPLCQCGCGAQCSNRYLTGHHRRLQTPAYVVEDRGYKTACWIWQRYRDKNGYGKLYKMLAHRKFYIERFGEIPGNSDLDHLCRVTSCVNPDHLEPVTEAENQRRGARAKLTPQEVLEIRRLLVSLPQRSVRRILAKQFDVSYSLIRQIHKGIIWRGDGDLGQGTGLGRRLSLLEKSHVSRT